jgi:hypothetical protein
MNQYPLTSLVQDIGALSPHSGFEGQWSEWEGTKDYIRKAQRKVGTDGVIKLWDKITVGQGRTGEGGKEMLVLV